MGDFTVCNQFTVYLVGPPLVQTTPNPTGKPEPQKLTGITHTNLSYNLFYVFYNLLLLYLSLFFCCF